MIDKTRLYAPYVFACRRLLGGFDIYILVAVGKGKTVTFPALEDLNLSETTNVSIKGTVSTNGQAVIVVGTNRFVQQHYILGALENVEKITVNIKNGDISNYKNTTRLESVEEADVLNVNDLAINSPYSYLTKKEGAFYPRILIPVHGTTYSSNNEDLILNDDGICISSIILEPAEFETQPSIVAPDKVNAASYPENEFEGFEYGVTVEELVLEGVGDPISAAQKKKKGTTNKGDADTD